VFNTKKIKKSALYISILRFRDLPKAGCKKLHHNAHFYVQFMEAPLSIHGAEREFMAEPIH